MRNRQLGVTAIGWLVLLTPCAIVIYAGIRLAPVYLNYMKVVRAVDNAANAAKSGGGTGTPGDVQAIRTAIDRHFEIDMVDYPTAKDIKITRQGHGWLIEAAYDDDAPLIANVTLHVAFDKVARVGDTGPE
jgi:hypothetical protein